MQASSTELKEGRGVPESVIFDLSQPVNRTVSISLRFTGSAERGIDYEINHSTLRFRPNQTRISLDLLPLDDWVDEETENFTISMSAFSEAVSAGAVTTIDFTIEDDGDRDDGLGDKRGKPDLFVYLRGGFDDFEIYGRVGILNVGAKGTVSTKLTVTVQRSLGDTKAGPVIHTQNAPIPPIEGNNGFYSHNFQIDLAQLEPGHTYWVSATVDPPSLSEFGGRLPNTDRFGVTLTPQGQVLAVCQEPERPSAMPPTGDPYLEHQWGLQNTGQSAFAQEKGVRGEDLRMTRTLADGTPTGTGVKVAVVDTGLEICHPDLFANVVAGGSYNFKNERGIDIGWSNIESWDPFLPDSTGDHGTLVAGVIAAKGNNGLGLRGVAPDVDLHGYNFLVEQCCFEDALGLSSSSPASDQIDIFNMSFGIFGRPVNSPDNSLHRYGTEFLRDEKGAIYVKAAGNGFRDCIDLEHAIHTDIGCSGSNGDPTNNEPYVIVVGAVSAHGDRSSYSSVGSNLWIAAPAGEYGNARPASISTDQVGLDRGYDSIYRWGLAENREHNPHGDYVSMFNGTSAAAPHISGVVALLLEVEPELTWRDVKHVLASTARKPTRNSGFERRVAIGRGIATLQRDWITNGAGYQFHNWYGFGVADVDRAVAMVRDDYTANSLGDQVITGWIVDSDVSGIPIPDHDARGVVSELFISDFAGMNIEAVQLNIDVSHPSPADLGIELTSPSGTTSILNEIFNNALGGETNLVWNLLSNAFYGEDPSGTWTVHVFDAATNDVGYMTSWGLQFWLGEHPN